MTITLTIEEATELAKRFALAHEGFTHPTRFAEAAQVLQQRIAVAQAQETPPAEEPA